MVEKPSWSADQDHASFSKSGLFTLWTFSTHDGGTDHIIEEFEELPQFHVDLDSKLSRWRKDDGHSSRFFSMDLLRVEAVVAQIFNQWHQVCQSLS